MFRQSAVLLTVALCLLAIAGSTTLSEWLVLDRVALQHGEYWRLFSAHLAHFGWRHAAVNMLVLILLLHCLRHFFSMRVLLLATTLSSLALSFSILAFEPGLARYAGASGLACALWAWLSLIWLAQPGLRWAGFILIAVLAVKLLAIDQSGLRWLNPKVRISDSAHILGALIGMLLFLCRQLFTRKTQPLAAKRDAKSAAPTHQG